MQAPRLGSAVEAAGSEPDAAGEGGAVETGADGRPILRLRHVPRGRRTLPHAPGLRPGSPEAAAAQGDSPGSGQGEMAEASAPAGGEEGAPAPAGEPAANRPPRRRRRRRPRPAITAAGEAAAAGEAGAPQPGEAGQARRPTRPRGRRGRPPEGAAAAGSGEFGARAPGDGRTGRARDGERRERARRGGPGRAERRDDTGRGPRDRRDRPGTRAGGRGRDAPARKIERKLYNIDAVVDRGFEDIEEEETGTRRVNWTILKRTVADQVTRKPVSTNYVLRREGGEDSEFPSLGAARNAVNKTIVHPEKLTLSKEEHATQRGKK